MKIKTYPNLLLKEDQDKLKALAAPNMTKAMVGRAGQRIYSSGRVAENFKFLEDNDITLTLKKFAANQFNQPLENVEPIEVCMYDTFGYYYLHRDDAIGDRLGAIYVALNDDYEGGDIFFPRIQAMITNLPAGSAIGWKCGKETAKEIRPITSGKFWLAMIYVNQFAQLEIKDTVIDTVSKESRKKAESKIVIPKNKSEQEDN